MKKINISRMKLKGAQSVSLPVFFSKLRNVLTNGRRNEIVNNSKAVSALKLRPWMWSLLQFAYFLVAILHF